MKNFSNLYTVIKNFLPLADKYLSNSPLEPYLPQIQNVIDIVESIGGIDTINSLFANFNNQQNNSKFNTNQIVPCEIETNSKPCTKYSKNAPLNNIDSYKKVD